MPAMDLIDQCRSLRRPLRQPWFERTPKRPSALKGRIVLVTGASGFIGGRLTERLAVVGDLSQRRLKLYAAKCPVSDRARQRLGFEPEADLGRGMELTARYIRWAYGHRLRQEPASSAGDGAASGACGA